MWAQFAALLPQHPDVDPVQAVLADLGYTGVIPANGPPAPVHVGERWVVERTHNWLNTFSILRRCTEQPASLVVTQQLVRAAFHDFRWPLQSTTRRLP